LQLLGLTGMPDYQDAAAVAGRGLAVFPLPAGAKRAEPGWQRRCTSDLAVLARTWPAGANIGVGCRASGIIGLDLNRHGGGTDGVAVFAALCRIYGQPWPDTLTVATPHAGLHLYFRVPPGTTAASTISRWPGIDIRALGYRSGGYLAGPGSVVDGMAYVVEHDVPIAALPAWLARLLDADTRTARMLTCPAPVP
jgi:Bifunctional DNA primase/polymerase, N-terminal